MRRLLYTLYILLGCTVLPANIAAQTQTVNQEPTATKHIFGFAFSFESIDVYMTSVQKIDSLKTGDKGIVLDRDLLSAQLKRHLAAQNKSAITSMVFIGDTPKEAAALQKDLMKVYEKETVLWHVIQPNEFTFQKP